MLLTNAWNTVMDWARSRDYGRAVNGAESVDQRAKRSCRSAKDGPEECVGGQLHCKKGLLTKAGARKRSSEGVGGVSVEMGPASSLSKRLLRARQRDKHTSTVG